MAVTNAEINESWKWLEEMTELEEKMDETLSLAIDECIKTYDSESRKLIRKHTKEELDKKYPGVSRFDIYPLADRYLPVVTLSMDFDNAKLFVEMLIDRCELHKGDFGPFCPERRLKMLLVSIKRSEVARNQQLRKTKIGSYKRLEKPLHDSKEKEDSNA